LYVTIYLLSTRKISHTYIMVYYGITSLLFINACFGVFKYKKIYYDNGKLLITTYITNKSFEIPMTSVESIVKLTAFYQIGRSMIYKITFTSEGKIHKVPFFKSYDLDKVDDIESFLGVKMRKN
jgi:hypothetical protein